MSERSGEFFKRYDDMLDGPYTGPHHLRDPRILEITKSSLHYLEDQGEIKIWCYCIMPNHIHLVITLLDSAKPLNETMGSLKRFTS
jgi:putative transposase